MGKRSVMIVMNSLLDELDNIYDEDFVDDVIARVACNEYFTDEEIAEA